MLHFQLNSFKCTLKYKLWISSLLCWNSGSINGTEVEIDEDETEAAEKSVADRDQQKNEIQKHEEKTSALPTTPLRLSRLVPKLYVVQWMMYCCYYRL